MYSSPGTPTGSGWKFRSSTYVCVFAIGRPIVTFPFPRPSFSAVDQIVVSVGPYRFQSSAPRSISCAASSCGRPSPPHRIFSPGPVQPASTSSRHVAGVACITVAPSVSSSVCSWRPSVTSSRVATTTRAPTMSGRYISSPEMSNDSVVTETSTSAGVSPGCCAMVLRKLTTARCGIWTPLGRPVEPEV